MLLKVTIYTKSGCPDCAAAKTKLRGYVTYEEVVVDPANENQLRALSALGWNGHVPWFQVNLEEPNEAALSAIAYGLHEIQRLLQAPSQ
ncbi:MAG: hypothetical protein UX77_C0009G0028 [Parcubacteria group bacterium GW2011_GWA1_47_11]|nr:MAG: hypothetical protein UX77_C0009G0028 [Parcubacteria group bacterium GW2011_GWA1_47_11]